MEIVADRTVHNNLGHVKSKLTQFLYILFVHIRNREKKFLFVVFNKRGYKLGIIKFAGLTERNLALAVNDVTLKVKRNRFGSAEITHRVRHFHSRFLAETEIVIYCCARCEYDTCIIGKIHLGGTKFFGGQTLDLDERTKNHLNPIFIADIIIWRFLR